MDSAIIQPDLVMTPGNMFIQKPVLGDSTNTFKAGALVTNTAGVLVLIATAGVLIYGQTPDISHTALETVPQAFNGENHWVFDPTGGIIEINIGHANGTDVFIGIAGPAKQRSDVVIGGVYGILTPTTGVYAGVQFLIRRTRQLPCSLWSDLSTTPLLLITTAVFVSNRLRQKSKAKQVAS